jgi:hypothetical protein
MISSVCGGSPSIRTPRNRRVTHSQSRMDMSRPWRGCRSPSTCGTSKSVETASCSMPVR